MNFSNDGKVCIHGRLRFVCSRKLVKIKVHGHGVPVPANTVIKKRKTS